MNTGLTYLKVAVEAPLFEPLTYASETKYPRGCSLQVPLKERQVDGVVLGFTDSSGDFEIKLVNGPLEERPCLPEPFLKWLEWLSKYYLHPIGLVTSLAFPPLKKKGRKRSKATPLIPPTTPSQAPTYTQEQQKCIEVISQSPDFRVHLLHGVTGSGKTEVYLKLLGKTIDRGKRGVVIVPEISLTPQLIGRFSARFPHQVCVIHSQLSQREKTDQWWNFVDAKKKILIGARSALFCPIEDLGIIVIDEEHEASFKQDHRLMYHARDAAIKLCQLHNCPVILGSATPSLETWKNAQEGKYVHHSMGSRVSQRQMPSFHVVDMKTKKQPSRGSSTGSLVLPSPPLPRYPPPESPLPENLPLESLHPESPPPRSPLTGRPTSQVPSLPNPAETLDNFDIPFWMSPTLYQQLKETLHRGEQAVLFLNRRGIAPMTICSACGHIYQCPNCAISLTLHGKQDMLCHYCHYAQVFDENCSQCKSTNVISLGIGTELVETDLQKLFPKMTIARADRDEIQDRESLETLISEMETGHIDILVGTQMIAKGLDFPQLTLVGLVMADVGLNLPDFRSQERSFQLLTQVSGRAGRHSKEPGRVVIQTYNPEHISITTVNNYHAFVTHEMKYRRETSYPPFTKLASIRIQGLHLKKVMEGCQKITYRSQELFHKHNHYSSIKILGPAPAPITKLHNKFRYHFLLKSPTHHLLNQFCRQILANQKWIPRGVSVSIEIDPIKML